MTLARNAFGDSVAKAWSAELELKGAGGEPVDLRRTLASHGVADLPPNEVDAQAGTLTTTLALPRGRGDRPRLPRAQGLRPRRGRRARPPARSTRSATCCASTPTCPPSTPRPRPTRSSSWAAAGAGRLLRSPTVFEDVVKTICTTNCAWSATVRMTSALVDHLGAEAPDGRRAFPSPAAMAEAGEAFYRDVARAGYRGAYLRSLAESVAEGRLDLEALDDPELSDDEVAERLLALPGCGPYATAHMMMLLGRYSRLVLDSWTRPTYARLRGRKAADRTIERRFRRYRDYAGLAFWLYLTRDWVDDPLPVASGSNRV